MKHVDGISGNDCIICGERIPVSRNKKKELMELLIQYMNEGQLMLYNQVIPRICTALAEWGACMVYLYLINRKKLSGLFDKDVYEKQVS